jgi:hypothetical protein
MTNDDIPANEKPQSQETQEPTSLSKSLFKSAEETEAAQTREYSSQLPRELFAAAREAVGMEIDVNIQSNHLRRREHIADLIETGAAAGPFQIHELPTHGVYRLTSASGGAVPQGEPLRLNRKVLLFAQPIRGQETISYEAEITYVDSSCFEVLPKGGGRGGKSKEHGDEDKPDTGFAASGLLSGVPIYAGAPEVNYELQIIKKLNRMGPDYGWQIQELPPVDIQTPLEPLDHDERAFLSVTHGDPDTSVFEGLRLLCRPHVLCGIKGPPGTGKTKLLAAAVNYLVAQGKSCLIVAVAHNAVSNALEEIVSMGRELKEAGIIPELPNVAKKLRSGGGETPADGIDPLSSWKDKELWEKHKVIGAVMASTVSLEEKADYLFLEEAGQIPVFQIVPLTDLATHIALLGDNSQLPPIVQATHSDEFGMGQSGLTFLQDLEELPGLINHPGSRVVTLEVSHRMCRPICSLIGENFYPTIGRGREEVGEGENGENGESGESGESGGRGGLRAGINAHTSLIHRETGEEHRGLEVVQVTHTRAKKHCQDEVDIIVRDTQQLLRDYLFRSGDGTTGGDARNLTPDDFCILSFYRWQSAAIESELLSATGERFLCGTAHKLQGQGRPIVLVSLCTSSIPYLNNTAEWFLQPNIWNVSISRAQALCRIYGNIEALKQCRPKTLAGSSHLANVLSLLTHR